MSVRWDVLGFGSNTVDDLLYVDYFPKPDTKMRMATRLRAGGGQAATALVTVARQGLRAAFCGVLGDDELSSFTVREMEREGVDCSSVVYQADARPHYAIVIVNQNPPQRSIIYTDEGVFDVPDSYLTEEFVKSCRVLFMDSTLTSAGRRLIELSRRFHIPLVADLELNSNPLLADFAQEIDHLIIGTEMAEHLTGSSDPHVAVEKLRNADRSCCVVTAGKEGCWYSVGSGPVQHVPAMTIESVVDTTGCGDVFHGAYAACIAQGESIDLAVQVAVYAAGLKATKAGGRAGIPDRATVDRYLAQG